jgi:hypothetical protein
VWEGGRATDGREQHYTIACKGTVSSTLDMHSTFAFANDIIQHTILYERSLRQQSLVSQLSH